MTPILYIPKGLPASGKSTWAEAKVKSTKNTYIVSRDSIRKMLVVDYEDFPFGNSIMEGVVTKAVLKTTSSLISFEKSVILDETNLNQGRLSNFVNALKSQLSDFNRNSEFTIEYIDFTKVPLNECIKRDKERDRTIGEHIIRGMHKKYLAHESFNKETKK